MHWRCIVRVVSNHTPSELAMSFVDAYTRHARLVISVGTGCNRFEQYWLQVGLLEHEDGSGFSFNLKGNVYGPRSPLTPLGQFRMYYNCRSHTGNFELLKRQ